MSWKRWCAICAATLVGGSAMAQTGLILPANGQPTAPGTVIVSPVISGTKPVMSELPAATYTVHAAEMQVPEGTPGTLPVEQGEAEPAPGSTPPADPPWGPAPPSDVKFLQNALGKCCDWFKPTTGCDGKEKGPCLVFYGWLDVDYTFNNNGPGLANGAAGGPGLAPVMNRFGDEFLVRQLGLALSKPLDPKEWSLGFNAILIAGNDAQFLNPTAGWFAQTNERFGISFTDLNLSAHLDILTDGGVDIKAGRQTTCLGPMGALPFQRYFDSSDYEWFNEEEGRYTGVSANWIISKRLSWYNGIEIGGWGVFFDNPSGPDYLGQINYWLDEAAKKVQLTGTVLTGPTGVGGGNTTVTELTLHINWSKNVYQVISNQNVYSKAPLFFFGPPPAGYLERTYALYSYQGVHMSKTVDFNTRIEWYRDVDGELYPGGFSTPDTNYYETTVGIDWHPVKWLQIRPEVRFDWANNAVFGPADPGNTRAFHDTQLTAAIEALIKF
jgi:Putative beta-barrel porin-2, OmpL-like. bbp2